MEPVTIILAVWFFGTFLLLLLKYVLEEVGASWRGQTSPHLARKAAREQLHYEFGITTPGKALATRLTHRIENPPRRQWAAELRALLAELAADAVTEARVRHEFKRRARVYRRAEQSGWRVRTGGAATAPPPPPPEPEPEPDPPQETYPCAGGCGLVEVTDPDEVCDECAATPPVPDPPQDSTTTENDTTEDDDTERKEHPMPTKAATHKIDGDVRDPRTALKFAGACSGVSHGVVGEMDILAATLTRLDVGPRPVQAVRQLADAARTHGSSADKSSQRYEQHAVAQAEIAADEDVAGTARRTYLDTHGTDGPAKRRRGKTRVLRAADVTTPDEAAALMTALAQVYADMMRSALQVLDNHRKQGVTGEPITFLLEQVELATTIAKKAKKAAAVFRRHVSRRNDTVGKDPSLHGTQKGRYLDPRKGAGRNQAKKSA